MVWKYLGKGYLVS